MRGAVRKQNRQNLFQSSCQQPLIFENILQKTETSLYCDSSIIGTGVKSDGDILFHVFSNITHAPRLQSYLHVLYRAVINTDCVTLDRFGGNNMIRFFDNFQIKFYGQFA